MNRSRYTAPRIALALATVVIALGFASLGGIAQAQSAARTLAFDQQGLEPLANGFHYEGWLITGDGPVSTGKFNVDADGALVTLDGDVVEDGAFAVDADVADAASLVVLTIEPAGDTDVVPAASKYLGGDLVDGAATLTVASGAALGSDFADARGSFILATPTNGEGDDETSGVWFLDLSSGSPVAGLSLPALPAGWAYEGWAVIDGRPVSTGRFTDPAAADDFAGFSGDAAGPPFPGEDFLVNAPDGLAFPVDLSGAPIVISVEPSPDDSAAPFAFKPLVGAAPEDAVDRVAYALDADPGSAAAVTATLR